MPIDHDTQEPPDTAAGVALDAAAPGPGPQSPDATAGPSQPHDEGLMRAWEGLPPEAMILAPAITPVPMLLPANVWAMLVVAVDIVDDIDLDHPGEVALFAGTWLPTRPPADLCEGDLVVRLVQVDDAVYPRPDSAISVEMLLAHDGRWQRVGCWYRMGSSWPWVVAPTAAAVLGLHVDATEAAARCEVPRSLTSPPLITWARGGLAELLEEELVKAGDELVWNRRNLGVRHTARVRADGTLVLADGRVYANPSGATTALGGNHQNGWHAWQCMSDGRTLAELRAELRARRGR